MFYKSHLLQWILLNIHPNALTSFRKDKASDTLFPFHLIVRDVLSTCFSLLIYLHEENNLFTLHFQVYHFLKIIQNRFIPEFKYAGY